MRYFVRLCYSGTNYCGWQKQPNGISVQQVIEEAISRIYNIPIQITGCGRTDAGVHALDYVMHMDIPEPVGEELSYKLNRMLPDDVAVKNILAVHDTAHARFDAVSRAYEYRIIRDKDPFRIDTAWHFPFFDQIDFDRLKEAAKILIEFDDFFTYCKTHTDVQTTLCEIISAEWVVNKKGDQLLFEITANRFLRGMVRLILGMCLSVALKKMDIEEVHHAMKNKLRLDKAWSVPPQGLFLKDIKYDYF
jgi:tRNA pseudouridine38-40 synthase